MLLGESKPVPVCQRHQALRPRFRVEKCDAAAGGVDDGGAVRREVDAAPHVLGTK